MDENPKNEPINNGGIIGSWAFAGANNELMSGDEALQMMMMMMKSKNNEV